MLYGLSVFALVTTILPTLMVLWNIGAFRRPPGVRGAAQDRPTVSVLIPARNEERGLAQAVRAVLANRDVELGLIVLDDHSTDGTAEIVQAIAAVDHRVRLAQSPPMPDGWCGKQHACHNAGRTGSARTDGVHRCPRATGCRCAGADRR